MKNRNQTEIDLNELEKQIDFLDGNSKSKSDFENTYSIENFDFYFAKSKDKKTTFFFRITSLGDIKYPGIGYENKKRLTLLV